MKRISAEVEDSELDARAWSISVSTVQSYLERAHLAGLSRLLPEELDDGALEARLFNGAREGVSLACAGR